MSRILLIVLVLKLLCWGESAVLNFTIVSVRYPVFYAREFGQLGIVSREMTSQNKKIPAGSMYLYGGTVQAGGSSEQLLNDVWVSTSNGSAWTRVATLPSIGIPPGVSCFNPSTNDAHVIQYGADYALNLVGRNLSTWATIVPRSSNSSIFEYRDQPACIFDSQSQMYYFPGADLQSPTRNPSAELWTSTDSGGNWVLQNKNLSYGPRSHQSMAFYYPSPQLQGPDVLYVLGGRGPNKMEYHDLWASSDAGVTWNQRLQSYPWNSVNNEGLKLGINSDGILVVVFANIQSNSSEVWISLDGGLQWGQCKAILPYGLRRNVLLTWDVAGFLYLGSGYCSSCKEHYIPDLWRGSISFKNLSVLSEVCGVEIPEKGIGFEKRTRQTSAS